MAKTILLTGSTDGIGLEAARMLAARGHQVLLHGRDPAKLEQATTSVSTSPDHGAVEGCLADLSRMAEVEALAAEIAGRHDRLDVLINNAGVFRTRDPVAQDGLDVRFAVNTIAPYLLTRRLLPLLGSGGRVINVASAAQAPVNLQALAGRVRITDDFSAYAQSKLALTIWSRGLALSLAAGGPAIVALNPGSMLGTKMVREGFGVAGGDLRIGAEILVRAALADDFAAASGRYFDNDHGRFAAPHADALDQHKCREIVDVIDALLAGTRASTSHPAPGRST